MLCSQHVHTALHICQTFHCRPFYYNWTSLIENATASCQAVVHFIIRTPPLLKTPMSLVHRIYLIYRFHIPHKRIPLTFNAPSTFFIKSTTIATHTPLIFYPIPQTSTKLFLLITEDPEMSAANTLSTICPNLNGYRINLPSHSTFCIAGIYPPTTCLGFTNAGCIAVCRTFLVRSAGTSPTSTKRMITVLNIKLFTDPDEMLVVELLHTLI